MSSWSTSETVVRHRGTRNAARTATRVLATWCGLALGVASMTVLFLGMRAVLEVGGSCGSGGPYTIETACPKGAGWMVPVSVWTGLLGIGVYAIASARLPGPRWTLLAWPALFLSLGWNFFEFALDPESPSGTSIGWLICGIVFVLMGGVPLAFALGSPAARRAMFWADAPAIDESSSFRNVVTGAAPFPSRRRDATAPAAVVPRPIPVPEPDPSVEDEEPDDLTTRLERLAALFRRGDLTAEEYAAAKASVLRGEDWT
jgi:Short C-terminal domain